jgi:hypothetical protein
MPQLLLTNIAVNGRIDDNPFQLGNFIKQGIQFII